MSRKGRAGNPETPAWRLEAPTRRRRVRRLIGIPLLVLAIVWGAFATDAFVVALEPAVDTARLALGPLDERAALWRNPPVGRGDRRFRWEMSDNGDQDNGWSTQQAERIPAWLPLYEELNVDMVRVFLGWRYYQPNGPGALDLSYYADRVFSGFTDAGYEVELSLWNAPRWGVTGGLWRFWGDNTFMGMPPKDTASPDGPFCDFMDKLHAHNPGATVWQVWNEPDWPHGQLARAWNPVLPRFWRGDATQYGQLLAACSARIQRWGSGYDSAVGGVANPSYLDAALSVPGANAVDIVDMHFAAGTGHPDPDEHIDRLLLQAQELSAVARSHGIEQPRLSVSELSFAYSPEGADAQADFVAKVYATAVGLGWDHLGWWEINPRHDYYDTGLTDWGVDGKPGPPRPAFTAYAFNSKALHPYTGMGLSGDGVSVRVVSFVDKNGLPGLAGWTLDGTGSVTWPSEGGAGVVYDHMGNKVADVAPGAEVPLVGTLRYVFPAGRGL